MGFFGNKNDRLENLMDLLRLEKGVFYSQNEKNPIVLAGNLDCKSAIEGILTFISDSLGRPCNIVESYQKNTQQGSLMVVVMEVPDISSKDIHKLAFHFDVSKCVQNGSQGGRRNDWNTLNYSESNQSAHQEDKTPLGKLFSSNAEVQITLGPIGSKNKN